MGHADAVPTVRNEQLMRAHQFDKFRLLDMPIWRPAGYDGCQVVLVPAAEERQVFMVYGWTAEPAAAITARVRVDLWMNSTTSSSPTWGPLGRCPESDLQSQDRLHSCCDVAHAESC